MPAATQLAHLPTQASVVGNGDSSAAGLVARAGSPPCAKTAAIAAARRLSSGGACDGEAVSAQSDRSTSAAVGVRPLSSS